MRPYSESAKSKKTVASMIIDPKKKLSPSNGSGKAASSKSSGRRDKENQAPAAAPSSAPASDEGMEQLVLFYLSVTLISNYILFTTS